MEGKLVLFHVFTFVRESFVDDTYSLIHSSFAFCVVICFSCTFIHSIQVRTVCQLIIGDFFLNILMFSIGWQGGLVSHLQARRVERGLSSYLLLSLWTQAQQR